MISSTDDLVNSVRQPAFDFSTLHDRKHSFLRRKKQCQRRHNIPSRILARSIHRRHYQQRETIRSLIQYVPSFFSLSAQIPIGQTRARTRSCQSSDAMLHAEARLQLLPFSRVLFNEQQATASNRSRFSIELDASCIHQ